MASYKIANRLNLYCKPHQNRSRLIYPKFTAITWRLEHQANFLYGCVLRPQLKHKECKTLKNPKKPKNPEDFPYIGSWLRHAKLGKQHNMLALSVEDSATQKHLMTTIHFFIFDDVGTWWARMSQIQFFFGSFTSTYELPVATTGEWNNPC